MSAASELISREANTSTAVGLILSAAAGFRDLIGDTPIDPVAKFDNRPTWDNAGNTFDNRSTWDNWNKK
ncbi:multiple cyclophane-containing RiPP AmcA [Streptomyces sp. WZ-12]|uniref:multiple cyclophane-containing RiPP AmcA n=1 Tax=Streptomyces sp. WZ-12 TaxID=3030210 RepID=UPI0023818EB9|nr:multiple cyclophane-containing RiPP AmcA [Streptomyces sp. WZ-12]